MKVLLAPFTFIISFIKHFFIGVKFVFFDVWYNLIEYYVDKNKFKKREQKVNRNEVKQDFSLEEVEIYKHQVRISFSTYPFPQAPIGMTF